MTNSSLSTGSLPGSLATTFTESTVRSACFTVTDAVTPSGTGLKSRVAASAFSFW